MRFFNIGLSFFSIAVLVACSSAPKVGVENAGRETIIMSQNEEPLPSWVKDGTEKPFYFKDGELHSIGTATLNADSRIDAGFSISDVNARALIAKTAYVNLEALTHVASEGVSFDGLELRDVKSELSRLSATGIYPARKYYHKVAVTKDDGTIRTEYRFWSELKMSENDYRKAVMAAIKKAEGKPSQTAAFKKEVEKNFSRLLNGPEANETREPSNE